MLEIADILEATHGVLVSEGANKFSGISIDSRTVKKGELFVALKGERFDGHDFVHASLRTCAGALVSRAWARDGVSSLEGKAIIAVENPLSALQDVARSIRNKFRGPVIAVVGSNGKTTTKELISSILGTTFNVLKTEGNLNNHVGMPLSMTKAVPETEAMVLEMGTNRPGDVDQLCRIAFPDTAVITNIGYEHIEGFGSLEAVRDAELEIIPYVNKVVLNGDDDFLSGGISLKFTGSVITFGIENNECDVTARDIFFDETGSRFAIDISGKSASVDSRLSGRFNIYNSLAACAAAHSIGIDLDKIKKGLEAFGGVGMRFEIRRVGGITYLFDAYNANPSSMKASILELSRIARGNAEKPGNIRAIAVLGDMLELGDYGKAAHEELGRLLSELGIDLLIGAGPLMTGAVSVFGLSGRTGIAKASAEEAGAELGKIVREGDVVLIKGSRGMRMEKAMEIVEKTTLSSVSERGRM